MSKDQILDHASVSRNVPRAMSASFIASFGISHAFEIRFAACLAFHVALSLFYYLHCRQSSQSTSIASFTAGVGLTRRINPGFVAKRGKLRTVAKRPASKKCLEYKSVKYVRGERDLPPAGVRLDRVNWKALFQNFSRPLTGRLSRSYSRIRCYPSGMAKYARIVKEDTFKRKFDTVNLTTVVERKVANVMYLFNIYIILPSESITKPLRICSRASPPPAWKSKSP